MKANYKVVVQTPNRLVLKDLGPWDQFATITNAAESVVDEVIMMVGSQRRLFYFDSEGQQTELLIKDGRFAGFANVN